MTHGRLVLFRFRQDPWKVSL